MKRFIVLAVIVAIVIAIIVLRARRKPPRDG